MEARRRILVNPQLFDKDTAVILNARILKSSAKIGPNDDAPQARTTYIKCKPNTTYIIYKISTSRCVVATAVNTPTYNRAINQYTNCADMSKITFETDSAARFLVLYLYNGNYDNVTQDEMLSSLKIYAIR